MLSPLVSVLLPVRNAMPWLDQAVESILQSSLERFELVVVDDGSTDGSRERLRCIAAGDPRVRLLEQNLDKDCMGLVHALNLGLAACRAECVARMDADDLAATDRLEKQWQALQEGEADVVSCLVSPLSEEMLTEGAMRYFRWLNGARSSEELKRELLVESPLPHPSVLFRKSAVTAIGGYRNFDGPEDYDLWLRLLEAGCRFVKVPETLLQWRLHPDSLTRRDARYSRNAFRKRKFSHLLWRLQAREPGGVPESGSQRDTYIWGAGKTGGKLFRYLEENGVRIQGFVDIDPVKQGSSRQGLKVLTPESLEALRPRPRCIAMVEKWDARELIRARLLGAGFGEDEDFWIL